MTEVTELVIKVASTLKCNILIYQSSNKIIVSLKYGKREYYRSDISMIIVNSLCNTKHLKKRKSALV